MPAKALMTVFIMWKNMLSNGDIANCLIFRAIAFYCSDIDFFGVETLSAVAAIIRDATPDEDCWKAKSHYVYVIGNLG